MSSSGSEVCGQPPRTQQDLEESSRVWEVDVGEGRKSGGSRNFGIRDTPTFFSSRKMGEWLTWEGKVAFPSSFALSW